MGVSGISRIRTRSPGGALDLSCKDTGHQLAKQLVEYAVHVVKLLRDFEVINSKIEASTLTLALHFVSSCSVHRCVFQVLVWFPNAESWLHPVQ